LLVNSGRTRHGLFFAHLALEKILKAVVCKQTNDMAPRLHNLVRLYELAALPVDTAKIEILAEMNAFNIEGRYPESLIKTTHKGGVVDLYDSDGRSF
jgi:HEPN domain-containing protein